MELRSSIMSNPENNKLCRSYLENQNVIVFIPTTPSFLKKLSICTYSFQTRESKYIVETISKSWMGIDDPCIVVVRYSVLINTIKNTLIDFLASTEKEKFECAYGDIKIPDDILVTKSCNSDRDTYTLKFEKRTIIIGADTTYISFRIVTPDKLFSYRIENKDDYQEYEELIKYIEGKAFC